MRPFVLVTLLLTPLAASAVVATTSRAAEPRALNLWDGVGRMNGGSAVAVAPHLVLTAGHIGAGDFTLGSTVYRAVSSEAPPRVSRRAVDLRLVTVAEVLPTWYEIADKAGKGATVTMVGYGASGVVSENGAGYTLTGGSGQRSGSNAIARKGSTAGRGPTMRAALRQAGDAVLTGGDSGGGWFVDGKLAGISDFVYTTDKKRRNYGFSKKGYFGSGAIDLTNGTLAKWLDARIAADFATLPARQPQFAPVPEPGGFVALGLGMLLIVRRRPRR